MLFFYLLIYFQAGINFSNTSKYHLLINQLTCNDLKIILNSNISYICDEKINYTTGYDELSDFNIFAEKNIYISSIILIIIIMMLLIYLPNLLSKEQKQNSFLVNLQILKSSSLIYTLYQHHIKMFL